MYCIIHKLSIIYYHYKHYRAKISQPSGTFGVTYANSYTSLAWGPACAIGTDGKLYMGTWHPTISVTNQITVCSAW